ncbi:MAG: NADH-quinone oxidoreductase subunit L [Ktedonobacteraceae bacterium]|nr:NADH-quinone oxidoreductase subunit L [Ktedonobacteraceae bacterium]
MIGTSIFWLAPILPITVFVLLAVGLVRYGRFASGVAIVAMASAFLVSTLGLVATMQGARGALSLPWMTVGGRHLTLALQLDPLSSLVATIVAGVGLIIFVYAANYMAQDPRRGRFFAEFSLFAGSMLTLVLAGDIMTLFIAWELVGLCSYLLIGFWYERPTAPAAATKAFLITRLADLVLLAGILLLIGTVGSGQIETLLFAATHGKIAPGLLLTIALLLFIGAAGKSAQVPFQGWLPDAMAGPTPVSALLHSATMVVAGVFLVARLYPLFVIASPVLQVVAWVGVATALLGGAAALVELDLKRTLAYSTMSQIGLMFVGLGSGSLLAGVLLLLAQAVYKATLFLAAGIVDHAVEGTEFERMGGLFRRMPWTTTAFAIGAVALAGLPVTLALPAKDPVLTAAWLDNLPLFVVTLIASVLTALYSMRTFGLVFLGRSSHAAQNAHSVSRGLLLPLVVMAALIPIVLLANASLFAQPLAHLLGVPAPDVPAATALTLIVAFVGSAAGLGARFLWPQALIWPMLKRVSPLLEGEFGLKAVYRFIAQSGLWTINALGIFDRVVFDAFVGLLVKVIRTFSQRCSTVDRHVFDAGATSIAQAVLALARVSGRFDLRGFDASIQTFGQDVLALSRRVRLWQTGRIENYMLAVFIWGGGVVFIAVVVLIVR